MSDKENQSFRRSYSYIVTFSGYHLQVYTSGQLKVVVSNMSMHTTQLPPIVRFIEALTVCRKLPELFPILCHEKLCGSLGSTLLEPDLMVNAFIVTVVQHVRLGDELAFFSHTGILGRHSTHIDKIVPDLFLLST